MLSNEEITPPPSVDYKIGGTEVLTISGKIRESACEILFYLDADEISLPTIILNSLIKVKNYLIFLIVEFLLVISLRQIFFFFFLL